jgi:ribonuclease P protein component
VVSGLCFSRSQRLLTPRDYKQVFDGASLKVSCKEVLILARPNNLGHARLGLVVPKRQVRKANQRNRIKRITRESFRHQPGLGGVDAVVLARGGADRLDNAELRRQLNQLWRQLQRKAAKKSD